jgi:hypothetical protein
MTNLVLVGLYAKTAKTSAILQTSLLESCIETEPLAALRNYAWLRKTSKGSVYTERNH